MTDPLNYTTKAIIDLDEQATNPGLAAPDREGLRFITRLLRQAEVFVLPDSGELLSRDKPRPEVPGSHYKPPFPVVALEYSSGGRVWVPGSLYEGASCPKRIALAWEWDGAMPKGWGNAAILPVGDGVVIASIAYYADERRWRPIMAAAMIPYDCEYRPGPVTAYHEAMIETGRLTRKLVEAPRIEVAGLLPIRPASFLALGQQVGGDHAVSIVTADLMDELNAYTDLSLALRCNNVTSERQAQPERLCRARMKAGKMPLKDFHVLKIAGRDEGGTFGSGGVGSGVRSHLRRGHIRRLGPDRITWVNACMVRGSVPGFIDKQYAVQGAR